MSLAELTNLVHALVPGVAVLVLGYAALDDALDLGLMARAKGPKSLFNIAAVAQVVASDYGTREAVTLAGVGFAAALVASGSVKAAVFYALATGAAAELPNLKADVLSKVGKLFVKGAAQA